MLDLVSFRFWYICKRFSLFYSFSNRLNEESRPTNVSLFDRIRQASNCKLSMTDVMQVYGPNKITVGDFWTLIPPSEQTVREEKKIKESLPDYTPGWLTSTVCSINSCKFYILYRNLWRFCNFNAIHSFVRSFVPSFLPSFLHSFVEVVTFAMIDDVIIRSPFSRRLLTPTCGQYRWKTRAFLLQTPLFSK